MAYESSSGLGDFRSKPVSRLAARLQERNQPQVSSETIPAQSVAPQSQPTSFFEVTAAGTRSQGYRTPDGKFVYGVPNMETSMNWYNFHPEYKISSSGGKQTSTLAPGTWDSTSQVQSQVQSAPVVAEIVWPDPIMPARKFPSLARMMRTAIARKKPSSLSGIDDGSGSSNTAYYVVGGIAVVALGAYLYNRNKKAKR